MTYKEYLEQKYDYQELGHLFLLERKHACLYYKPGKGKTYPSVEALRDVDANKSNNAKVLILSTADAIKNMWQSEIVPQNILPKNTTLLSFTAAIQDKTKVLLLSKKWDVLIVDECHKVKSNKTQTSKLIHAISKKTEYVWGLSGTPRGNSDVDIYCQFHNLCISGWGTISYSHFVDECCDIEQKFYNGAMIKIPIGITHKYMAGWERNIAMYTQRIGYSDSDNMPELEVNTIRLNYTPSKEYLLAEDGIIKIPNYETTMNKLVAIQKAHQAANGFLYINDDASKIYEIEYNKKLDWLQNNLKKNTLIVYRFAADLKAIKNKLTSMNMTYTEIVNDFKLGDIDILLLQCSRCESFNLQMCNNIVFYTLDYSYIKYNQMLHRLWRMGQKEKVTVNVLIQKDTIEEKIWKGVQNKENFANLFMSIKGV